jgi:hypothetical protein
VGDTGKRAFGRSLKDFWLDGEEGRLLRAEQRLLEACAKGAVCELGPTRPEQPTADSIVRAGFVRFLALGGDADAPVHEKGLRLSGAWIEGALDLESAEVPHSLQLDRCRIQKLMVRDAKLRMLNLWGSCVEAGIEGDRLRVTGGVFLRHGFRAKRAVELLGAHIGGDLDYSGGAFSNAGGKVLICAGMQVNGSVILNDSFHAAGGVWLVGASIGGDLYAIGGAFENADATALACDRLQVARNVFLYRGFRAVGEVRLSGAHIGGNLECDASTFQNAGRVALNCEQIHVLGSVFLRNGFHAIGNVRLQGANIGGLLECDGGVFENAGGVALTCDGLRLTGSFWLRKGFRAVGAVQLLGASIGGDLSCQGGKFENSDGMALVCDGARVEGRFFFSEVATLRGRVQLSGFHVGTLLDDAESWVRAKDRLILDGFTYGRIDGDRAFTGAKDRIAWLKLQQSSDLKEEFRPQPWEQLIKVLREMGHPNEANKVAIEKQRALRRAGRIEGRVTKGLHWLYGKLVGYGYRPIRLVGMMVGVWAVCALAFWWASTPGALPISPPESQFVRATVAQAGDAGSRRFDAALYALDVVLPISVGYEQQYRIDAPGLRWLATFGTMSGWIGSLLLLGVLGNLLKKD